MSMDINAVVGAYLQDLAWAQPSPQQKFGYKRAARAILSLDTPLTDLVARHGGLPKIHGIGPASRRVIDEVLETGASPTVEDAIDRGNARAEIERRRSLRHHFLSRSAVLRILADPTLDGPSPEQYQGDLQMHSQWSDGNASIAELADACRRRGYSYAAVTDHSYGLRIAGGMSMEDAAAQREHVARFNSDVSDDFLLLQGVEANIDARGELDLTAEESALFDLVLAAPHSRLRTTDDQTSRMIAAIRNPRVRILAHPRGRMIGSRAGVSANWSEVFAAAAERGVAIEIDGDPARQDLDYTLAREAFAANCLIAVDSDAHTTDQLAYAETALAHARLAGVSAERIVNCWPLPRLLEWLAQSR